MLWNDIDKVKPHAYNKGDWDGKRSDILLVCTLSGRFHLVFMYEWHQDGQLRCDFYDMDDYHINNVKYWIEIDSPC